MKNYDHKSLNLIIIVFWNKINTKKQRRKRWFLSKDVKNSFFFPDLAQLAAHSNLLSPLLQRHSVMLFYNFFFF